MRKLSKASKRRLMFFGIPAILIVISFIVGTSDSIYNIIKLKNETKQLEQKLTDLKDEEEKLSVEISKLKDPDYIARYARENYLYSKDGEYVIKIEEKEDEEIQQKAFTVKTTSLGSIAISIFIIYIIKKKLI